MLKGKRFFSALVIKNHLLIHHFHLHLLSQAHKEQTIVTTATNDNVHLDDNGTVITCRDSSIPQLANIATIELAVSSGIYHNKIDCVYLLILNTGPPTEPLNLKFCFNLPRYYYQ